MPYTTSHRFGRARSPKRAARPEPRYADETGYARALKRSFTEHIRHAIRLSHLRFFFPSYSIQVEPGSDRHFPTWFENLRPAPLPQLPDFPLGLILQIFRQDSPQNQVRILISERTQKFNDGSSLSSTVVEEYRITCPCRTNFNFFDFIAADRHCIHASASESVWSGVAVKNSIMRVSQIIRRRK